MASDEDNDENFGGKFLKIFCMFYLYAYKFSYCIPLYFIYGKIGIFH